MSTTTWCGFSSAASATAQRVNPRSKSEAKDAKMRVLVGDAGGKPANYYITYPLDWTGLGWTGHCGRVAEYCQMPPCGYSWYRFPPPHALAEYHWDSRGKQQRSAVGLRWILLVGNRTECQRASHCRGKSSFHTSF